MVEFFCFSFENCLIFKWKDIVKKCIQGITTLRHLKFFFFKSSVKAYTNFKIQLLPELSSSMNIKALGQTDHMFFNTLMILELYDKIIFFRNLDSLVRCLELWHVRRKVLVHIGWSHDCLYIKYAIMGDLVHMVWASFSGVSFCAISNCEGTGWIFRYVVPWLSSYKTCCCYLELHWYI